MTNEEFLELLQAEIAKHADVIAIAELSKKLDKILNQQTKIAKALHLLPVTEKEEKELYQMRLRNSNATQQLLTNIENDSPLKTPPYVAPNLAHYFSSLEGVEGNNYFSDVLADDLNTPNT